jgi:hypothetical protein
VPLMVAAFRVPPTSGPIPDGGVAAPTVEPPPPLPSAKPASPATVAAEELASAVSEGVDGLERLTAKYPRDPAVWRALIQSYASKKRNSEAMEATSKLAELGDEATDDNDVHDAVIAALLSADGADAAMGLVEGPLGAKGVDWMYEAYTQRKLPYKLNQRIKQSLAKQDVRTHASAALLVTLELRSATGCDAKKALLLRARDHGDQRTLPFLLPLLARSGCGGFFTSRDCWPCLRENRSLEAAIAAINARLREESGKSGARTRSGK